VSDHDRLEPSDEFLQHHTVEKIETTKAGKKRTRVTDQLWIDYYLKHGHIKSHQHITAERLLALYRAAGQAQKVTGSLDALPSGNAAQSDRSADALMDFFKLKWLMGEEMFGCVQDVVLYDFSAPEWAKRNGRNPKAATEILRLALDSLEDAFKRLHDRTPTHHRDTQ
tara:strand:- start:195 stop:698 length:504 start_codon:yes stop_codon:yes gene_type:complete